MVLRLCGPRPRRDRFWRACEIALACQPSQREKTHRDVVFRISCQRAGRRELDAATVANAVQVVLNPAAHNANVVRGGPRQPRRLLRHVFRYISLSFSPSQFSGGVAPGAARPSTSHNTRTSSAGAAVARGKKGPYPSPRPSFYPPSAQTHDSHNHPPSVLPARTRRTSRLPKSPLALHLLAQRSNSWAVAIRRIGGRRSEEGRESADVPAGLGGAAPPRLSPQLKACPLATRRSAVSSVRSRKLPLPFDHRGRIMRYCHQVGGASAGGRGRGPREPGRGLGDLRSGGRSRCAAPKADTRSSGPSPSLPVRRRPHMPPRWRTYSHNAK